MEHFRTKIISAGKSAAIIIPKENVDEYGAEIGDEVEIIIRGPRKLGIVFKQKF